MGLQEEFKCKLCPKGNTSPASLVDTCASHLKDSLDIIYAFHVMFSIFIRVLIFKTWCKYIYHSLFHSTGLLILISVHHVTFDLSFFFFVVVVFLHLFKEQ